MIEKFILSGETVYMQKQFETFREYAYSNSFSEKLRKHEDYNKKIKQIIESGYYIQEEVVSHFSDSYYGRGFMCDFNFNNG